jgi:hypothetical protein
MNPKTRPNHHQYLQTLRNMTEEQRLQKAFELGEFSRQLFKAGLRERFPERSEAEIHELFLKFLKRFHYSRTQSKLQIYKYLSENINTRNLLAKNLSNNA